MQIMLQTILLLVPLENMGPLYMRRRFFFFIKWSYIMIHRGQLHLIDILSQVMQLIDSVIVILTKLYPIRIKNSVQHIVHAVV